MCNNKTVFTKSAQKLYMLQFYSVYPFHWTNSAGIFIIAHGLDVDFSNLKGHDACILLMKESHLSEGDWVYIETPAKQWH